MSNRVSKAKEIKVIWSQDNKQSTLFQNGEILQFPGRARGGHPWGRRQTCCRWLLCWMVSNLQTATGHARSLACPVDMPDPWHVQLTCHLARSIAQRLQSLPHKKRMLSFWGLTSLKIRRQQSISAATPCNQHSFYSKVGLWSMRSQASQSLRRLSTSISKY